jgi:hypothetical protein
MTFMRTTCEKFDDFNNTCVKMKDTKIGQWEEKGQTDVNFFWKSSSTIGDDEVVLNLGATSSRILADAHLV